MTILVMLIGASGCEQLAKDWFHQALTPQPPPAPADVGVDNVPASRALMKTVLVRVKPDTLVATDSTYCHVSPKTFSFTVTGNERLCQWRPWDARGVAVDSLLASQRRDR